MKFKTRPLTRQLALAFGSAVLSIAAPTAALAQGEAVVVTGSSIKRIAAEGALPIQSYNAEAIKRSGATSAADFIQGLAVMQGFTHSSDSVGGGGGGTATASIHDLDNTSNRSSYTLVLLNGRRMAAYDSGTSIDLNTIPMDAIERVEVLTDGASALYGSDAIAGVVNFIMKSGKATPVTLSAKLDAPTAKGGKSSSFGISKGFGDLDEDGFSMFASLSHTSKQQLKAADRDFAKTGILDFRGIDRLTGQSVDLNFFNGSSRSIPANAAVSYIDAAGKAKTVNINPYFLTNGKCAPGHKMPSWDTQCYFDYTSTVEIAPEDKNTGLFLTGKMKLGSSGFNLFSDLVLNKHNTVSRIAPYPAEFSIANGSPLFTKYIEPHLTAEQKAGYTSSIAKYRLLEVGNRATDDNSFARHFVTGVEGEYAGWDINSAVTLSSQRRARDYVGGWVLEKPFLDAVNSGLIDPFAPSLDANAKKLLNSTVYNGNQDVDKVSLNKLDFKASRSVMQLPAGAVYVAAGADVSKTKYNKTVSSVAANAELLFESPADSFGFSRNNAGVFAEVLLPVSKQWEVTGAVRHDQVGKLSNDLTNASVGNSSSANTYKISSRYQVNSDFLVRGSVGTGFKAPDMMSLGRPLTDFGVTSGSYPCPLAGTSHPLASLCSSAGKGQLEVFQGGNADLKPERSKQFTLGFVAEPTKNISMSLDYWRVNLTDQITGVSEALIASDPIKYAALYTQKYKASTGQYALAIKDVPINIGKSEVEGIDWNVAFRNATSLGQLTTRISGTHLMKSRYTTPGTSDSWETSLGKFGSNDAVSFRNVFNASTALQTDQWTHILSATHRSGYYDVLHTADICAVDNLTDGTCAEVQLQVKAQTIFGFKSIYRPQKNVELIAGISNLLNAKPRMSLRTSGAGHQVGYDPRYSDAYGRTLNLSGSYKF